MSRLINRLSYVATILLVLLVNLQQIWSLEVIYALNAGGDAIQDSLGIRYRRDNSDAGTASDYGRSLDIKRVPQQDKILYQTERYATETFGYSIPMPTGDGDYVLWLKFSEVWFNAPNQKVFDVTLNDHTVVEGLDIFSKVGRGVAHDELVPFQIRQNKLIINGKSVAFSKEIKVDFVKTQHDNPKVNAIVIVKGTVDQIPQLPPYTFEKPIDYEDFEDPEGAQHQSNTNDEDREVDEEEERARREYMRNLKEQQQEESSNSNRIKKEKKHVKAAADVKIEDPYEADETSYIIPIVVALGAFIPLLYCLCKL